MTLLDKFEKLKEIKNQNAYSERIVSELIYLDGVSALNGDSLRDRIEAAADAVLASVAELGAVTAPLVFETEKALGDLSPLAKSYTDLFIAHAHIDMNWQWGYNETAMVTVDTFRTVLDLMRDYPEMTYAQSQASTYEIVEKYAPELLDEIRQRIREGRWEVTAAEWVEPDKNMPDGESLVRHLLRSRKYLSRLLGISESSLDLDFVPDTFGHNLNVPEILSGGGVRYMYHCRGYDDDGPCIYRYVSPSGKSTLNYREYTWYNGDISPVNFETVPSFCAKEGVKTHLCVFGVGDHGGGPSRRDIERILEYASWPLTPRIEFGTFRRFFSIIEKEKKEIPEMRSELNCLFTGCYTTQTRIKAANRLSETRMNETEALGAFASLLSGAKREQGKLDTAWQNLLFNHFHDILPGSGTIETREYALGKFQDVLAAASTSSGLAMRQIAEKIDTSAIGFDLSSPDVSEGAGAGYFQSQQTGYRLPSAERGRGKVRALHLFNTTGHDRNDVTELTVWDYSGDPGRVRVTDAEGKEIPFQIASTGEGYWGHRFMRLYVRTGIPAFGYTTVVLSPDGSDGHVAVPIRTFEKRDEWISDAPVVMENRVLRAVFDRATLRLLSLTDKRDGREYIGSPSCFFRLVRENPLYGMTSWRVGYVSSSEDLNSVSAPRFCGYEEGKLEKKLWYQMDFGSSRAEVRVSLREDSDSLDFSLHLDWNEAAQRGVSVPQLSFAVPVGYRTKNSLCGIPFGSIRRSPAAHDVPAISFFGAEGEGERGLGLIAETKYGFRLYDDTASVTLVRSAYDPDPYPDRGIHDVRFAVTVGKMSDLQRKADLFCHPVCFVSAKPPRSGAAGSGEERPLPLSGAPVRVCGDVSVSCVKNSEDGTGTVIRLFNDGAEEKTAQISVRGAGEAYLTDLCENVLSPVSPGAVKVAPYSVTTVLLR